MEKPRVIVIGIDGGTWNLIKPWAEKGELPTFRFLLENGAWGELESTIPPVTGPAWVSFSTGKNPGKHGVFDFVKLEDNSLKLVTSKDIEELTVYDILSRRGFRNVIIGLPLSYPPKDGFKGIMISDFLYPRVEIYSDFDGEGIENIISGYRILPDFTKEENLIERLIEISKNKLNVARKLFDLLDWNFYFLHFLETDFVCHRFWKDIKNRTEVGKKAKEVFQIVDDFLNWLLDRIDEKSILFIMSDHGFADHQYVIRLNRIFMKNNFLKVRIVDFSEMDESLYRHVLENLLNKKEKKVKIPKLLFKLASNPMIKPISKRIFRAIFKDAKISYSKKIDFTNSKVFIPTTESMGVYINETDEQKKRELAKEIKMILSKLEYRGQKVFKRILTKNEVYSGPLLDFAPDIVLIPNGFIIDPSLDGKIFETFEPGGYHDPYGIFLAYGKDIKRGCVVDRPKIYDLAPTILHIFGLPIPNDIDGRVLMEIFEECSEFARREPTYTSYYDYNKILEERKLREKVKELKLKKRI